MSIIYRYSLILLACVLLLMGIQIPSFVDQYEKRLDAHFIEVKTNLRGFQEIADTYFGGSLEALINKHEQSGDEIFREEARPIRSMYQRYLRFSQQKLGLNTHLVGKVFFISTRGDKELLEETRKNYSYTIPLDKAAVYSGFATAGIILLIIEILRVVFFSALRLRRRRFASNKLRQARPLANPSPLKKGRL